MITAERIIQVKVAIFGKSLDDINRVVETLHNDFISVVQHYSDEFEEEFGKDLQVHLRKDSICGNCGKIYPKCVCGKPHVRPAV